MRPRTGEESGRQGDLFGAQLEQILSRDHALYRLANGVHWSIFEQEFGAHYVENLGRPGVPMQLVVGLHYLKYCYNESDEPLVERFLENPYWQNFCGYEYFKHEIRWTRVHWYEGGSGWGPGGWRSC